MLLEFCYEARETLGPDPHLECVLLHFDPLDEQLHDPSLLGGEQLVPDCSEVGEQHRDLALGDLCRTQRALPIGGIYACAHRRPVRRRVDRLRGYLDGAFLRQGQARGSFEYSGIVFEEYRGQGEQGRDPLAPLQDVINDEGDIVVRSTRGYLGLWLTGLFGDPDTTDNLDGSWDHEFASGGDDLPSYTIEVGMPKVPAFFRHAGVKLNSIALEFTRSGPAAATINAIAQGETRFGTTQGGTPTSLTFSRISQFQGSIKRAGSPVGNLTGGSVTYSNNLEKIETIRDDGLIEGADPTIAALTGRIDVRFADTTLIDLAAGGTPVDLEFAYTLSAQAKLVLTAHEVYLPKPKLAVEGPGGVQASFDFRGAKNTPPVGCSRLRSPTTSMGWSMVN